MIDFILDLLYTIFRIIFTGILILGVIIFYIKLFKEGSDLWK